MTNEKNPNIPFEDNPNTVNTGCEDFAIPEEFTSLPIEDTLPTEYVTQADKAGVAEEAVSVQEPAPAEVAFFAEDPVIAEEPDPIEAVAPVEEDLTEEGNISVVEPAPVEEDILAEESVPAEAVICVEKPVIAEDAPPAEDTVLPVAPAINTDTLPAEIALMAEDATTESANLEAEACITEDASFTDNTKMDYTMVFTPDDDPLHHTRLNSPYLGAEILADEQAVAGRSTPSDAAVDRIIEEAKAMAPEIEPEEEPRTPFLDAEYRDTFGENGESLTEAFRDQEEPYDLPIPPEPETPAAEEPKPAKRRPRGKKGYGLLGIPHILATVLWLAIAVLIGVSLGRMLWAGAAEILAFGRPDHAYTITISTGDNIDTIATKLKNAGLIKYPELFKLYADVTNADEEISPGTFTLNSKFDYHALVNAMTYHSPSRETIEVLIPEGYTCAQIFALLEEKGVCTAAELEEYAAHGEIRERWFLEGVERGHKYCLEGYLFPDTYEFYTNDEASRVLGKFLDTFDARFTDIMKEKIDPLNERMAKVLASRGYTEAQIEARKLSLHDIITIASMIEKETANDSESYDVSSVIYNRLTNPANYPYLNIDATIIYALGGNIDPETGKTKPLTSEDKKLDSPYNTYTVKGMIPGPISNPGRNSINAALDPNETPYYYYVYNPNTSTHIFAKTEEEHNKNVSYVRSLG